MERDRNYSSLKSLFLLLKNKALDHPLKIITNKLSVDHNYS